MKTEACCFLVTMALVMVGNAQEEITDEGAEDSYLVPAVMYEAPVVYHAPVIYQAPVVYFAPVYYLTAAPLLDAPPPCPAPSTVVYIGGRGNSYAYSHCGVTGSTVMHIGQVQACAYGYQFNLPR